MFVWIKKFLFLHATEKMWHKKYDLWRVWANVFFAIAQMTVGFLPRLLGVGFEIGGRSLTTQTPVIPAGFTFAIWGPIFALCLGYALFQALPIERANPILRRVGFLTALAFFGNTFWQLVAQFVTFAWPTALILAFIVVCALGALWKLKEFTDRFPLTFTETLWIYVPLSLLAGWVSFALFANISSVLFGYGLFTSETALLVVSIVLLLLAVVSVCTILLFFGPNLWFCVSVFWALFGVIWANMFRSPNEIMAISALLLYLPILSTLTVLKVKK